MRKMKTFLFGIVGVLIGVIVVSFIRNGRIDWGIVGILIALIIIALIFRLGLNLYKK